MQAVILSGGFGTRLRPLTFSCPKPLIPLCNVPILEHQISALSMAGVKKILLAISNNAFSFEKLQLFVEMAQRKYRVKIVLSVEDEPLGTAGPIALAERHITTENFFVLNSDIICEYPFGKMFSFHIEKKALGTIYTVTSKSPWKYGVVLFEKESGKILNFEEKPKNNIGNTINGGIFCYHRKIFDYLKVTKMSMEREVFPILAQESKLFSYASEEKETFWMDIGQPKDYLAGTNLYIDRLGGKPIIGQNVIIGEGANIENHVVIGDNCVIEEGVVLQNCVLFSGSIIKKSSSVAGSIIGWDCVVRENVFEKISQSRK
ncbi:hypothetical protein MHBO_002228 [Bonamia ostreae]|uniref:Nucleotidyl transferase domain-containing protein n=1 Tax=Bonamia ostreae TaxID=126728 RepID=A0ABV2ALM9_9EUKA